ncbi:MAG TPA: hypothetical protein VFX98_01215, partial [Longimicrobiaceae bacterium]|nr:hypothetical protein [Longimicrobiaceae bacterium]
MIPSCALAAQQRAIDRARSAFMQHDFAAAEAAYRDVLRTDTVTAHRVDAATTLASLAWRLRGDTAAAGRVLAEIESIGPAEARLERARMLRASHAY